MEPLQLPPIYFGDFREISSLQLKSLIGDVREFKYFREETMKITMVEAAKRGYEIDRLKSEDGAVIVCVRGSLIGRVVNIVTENNLTQNSRQRGTITIALETTSTPMLIQFV